MKIFIYFFFILLINFTAQSRNIGETEITTEEGIEVYQDEKYYLLKKNVKINSDNFTLNGNLIKIYFDKDLYDINRIEAFDDVELVSEFYNVSSKGKKLDFIVNSQIIFVEGEKSELITDDFKMFSDGFIKVNNISGNFLLEGPNSKILNEDIIIEGNYINGRFTNYNDEKEIDYLNIIDEKSAYVDRDNTEMYAKKINFDNETSLIELIDNVKIIRDGETIMGDYGTLDTKENSYKIKSNNSKKVTIIISNEDE